MALRKILSDNHPVLRTSAREVKNINSGVQRLIDDMLETLRDAGGVGLAANQVGVLKRILIAQTQNEEYMVMINPSFTNEDGEEIGVEGCLSIPGLYGEVSRAKKVSLSALNRQGEEIMVEAEGLTARILQHEMDHLNGVLFTDKCLRYVDSDEIQDDENSEKNS